MFNGIIFNQGKIKKIINRKKGSNLFLKSNLKLSKKDLGVSICCDGVCLTLVSLKNGILEFYLSKETIKRSKFNKIRLNDNINLELPLKYGQKISGHVCQGHVDTTAKVKKISIIDKSFIYEFLIPKRFKKFLIEKASILINGVSLTISKVTNHGFQIWAIPHTLKLTNLKDLKKNHIVNIEIDILSKYVKKFINEKK
ncbi:riboflavin synthase [Candidatus Pelagibacter sp.]|nr:riboflavin synthase [Candidatus Pelagibacter sp.]